MIKHLSLIAVFIILHSLGGLAQSKVTVGKPYEVIDAPTKLYFARGGEILTVKVQKRNVTIQKLNSIDLTFKKIKLYDDFPKGTTIEKITQFKNRYFLFYSLYEDKHEQLFCREIDFAGGSFVGTGKKIITNDERIPDPPLVLFQHIAPQDKYDFYFSYDSSSMVIQYRVAPEFRKDSKNFDRIGLHVFDQNMSEKWGKHVEMPFTEKKMDNLDYTVDSKGNVYIATRIFDDNTTNERKRGEDEPNYHLEILKVAASSGTVSTTKVDVADKFVKTIWLYENAKGNMVGGGDYNKGERDADADGVILFKLGSDGKLSDFNAYEIPSDVLNQYATSKEKRQHNRKDKDDKAEFENLSLREVINGKDGSMLLVGEQRYSITTTHYNSTTHSSTKSTTYYSNDVLITKIDPSGKLAWMKKLPKRQRGSAGYFGLSYRYVRGNLNHYFFYLDNEKNRDLPLTEVPAAHISGLGGFLTAYIINDNTGDVVKKSLLDTRDIQGMEVHQFDPDRIMFTAPYTLVFEAYKKKNEDILVKVVLDH